VAVGVLVAVKVAVAPEGALPNGGDADALAEVPIMPSATLRIIPTMKSSAKEIDHQPVRIVLFNMVLLSSTR
jgi:hypothetical protein